MGGWRSVLNGYPVEWLLEGDDYSVRYFTLTGLLDKNENDDEVIDAKRGIMEIGHVPRILEKQSPGGHWGKPEDFYLRYKYKGSVWTLTLLAELGADGADARIRRACEFVMNASQDPESGGFAYAPLKNSGLHGAVVPCLTGNMAWSLIRFGYLDDPRVQKSIDFITKYRRFDDGIPQHPRGWPYDQSEKCWGRHTCHMGIVKALKALAEIPERRRSAAVKDTIAEGAEYLLMHHIFKKSHDLDKVSMPQWLKFGYPTMWNTDILEVVGILTKLGYRDERMREAMDVIVSKQDKAGKWKQEDAYGGRYLARIEKKEGPSKWNTLHALEAIRSYYG